MSQTLQQMQSAADGTKVAATKTPEPTAPTGNVAGEPTTPIVPTTEPATEPTEGEPTTTAKGKEPEPVAAPLTKDDEPRELAESETPLLDYCAEHWQDQYNRRYDLSKYKSDQEFIDAVPQLWQLLGERNEDAALGKKYRDRQTDIDAFLKSGPTKPDKSQPKPPTWEQIQLLRARVYDQQGQLRSDADPKAVEELSTANDRMAQTLHALSTEPETVLKPLLDSMREEIRTQLTETQTVQQQQQQINAWTEQNKQQLFVGGDVNTGLTDFGQRVAQFYTEYKASVPDELARLQLADRLAKAESVVAGKPKPPPPRAGRKPGVAVAKTEGPTTAEQMFRDKKTFAEVAKQFQ